MVPTSPDNQVVFNFGKKKKRESRCDSWRTCGMREAIESLFSREVAIFVFGGL